jgi:2-polyprenyl-3-methyl-5-hydroxy-6-metoxy-1,4-benzoquinol methylase
MNPDAATANFDLILVCGPSSCGKSSFIRWAAARGLLPKDFTVCVGSNYENVPSLDRPIVMHYNTLRPIDLELEKMRSGQPSRYGALLRQTDFKADPAWRAILEYKGKKRAFFLLTREAALWNRVTGRRWIDAGTTGTLPYPSDRWLSHYRRIDLAAHYFQFLAELEREQIPYEILDAEAEDYAPVACLADVSATISRDLSRISYGELRQLIAGPIFEYQRIKLPHGLETPGQDRADALPLVFPMSLAGKSVLDVGCALGFFCFEAEARGATTIVGLEKMERRFEAARLLGRIKSSKVEFRFLDVEEDSLDHCFDVVLLLNVIHHLRQPFQVIRQLAQIARQWLIIEFPTLADVRFRETIPNLPANLNDYPLIGVSSLGQVDQTFVYSPAAVRRLLTEQLCVFREVEIVPSPMANRFMARCRK